MQYMLLLSLVEYWVEYQTRGRNLQNLEKKIKFFNVKMFIKIRTFLEIFCL